MADDTDDSDKHFDATRRGAADAFQEAIWRATVKGFEDGMSPHMMFVLLSYQSHRVMHDLIATGKARAPTAPPTGSLN